VQAALDGTKWNPQHVGRLLVGKTAQHDQDNHVPEASGQRLGQHSKAFEVLASLQLLSGTGIVRIRDFFHGTVLRARRARPAAQAEPDRTPSLVLAQQVDRTVGRDAIEPGAEWPLRIEHATLQVDLKEDRLQGILGQVGTVQVLAQVAGQLALVSMDEFLERLASSLPRVADQQIFIRTRGPGRLSGGAMPACDLPGLESARRMVDELPVHFALLRYCEFECHRLLALWWLVVGICSLLDKEHEELERILLRRCRMDGCRLTMGEGRVSNRWLSRLDSGILVLRHSGGIWFRHSVFSFPQTGLACESALSRGLLLTRNSRVQSAKCGLPEARRMLARPHSLGRSGEAVEATHTLGVLDTASAWDKVESSGLVLLCELPMMDAKSPSKITHLLHHAKAGDRRAVDRLFHGVYQGLRDLAEQFFRREPPGQTIQPTALVHEAYIKLIDQKCVDWQGQTHFLAVAAQAMRRILVDRARHRGAVKRGGGWKRVTLSDKLIPGFQPDDDLVALDEALVRLAELDPRQAQMVEMRFFGGLSVEETAKVLGISKRSAEREWTMVRAWLRRELSNRDTA